VRRSRASVFLRADFAHLGHDRQVSRALNELESERILVRARYGVYTRSVAEVAVEQLVSAVKSRLGRRLNRLVKVPNPEDDLDRAARIIRCIERLCADREPPQ
jgi:hypothetical protein